MTVLIQPAENRDAQVTYAKLDELLDAQTNASNELRLIDQQEPEDIKAHRANARSDDAPSRT